MDADLQSAPQWLSRPTLHPHGSKWLRRLDAIAQLVGMTSAIIGHGQRRTGIPPWEFGAVSLLAMLTLSVSVAIRYRWSLAKPSFGRRHWATVLTAILWTIGIGLITVVGPVLPDLNGEGLGGGRWWGYVTVTETLLGLYALYSFIHGLRKAASRGVNPAFLLVMSFVLLISVGALVLMLPICRTAPINQPLEGAPWLTALFTSTSASCVTGLVVEHTGTYWSPVGQIVIMLLFQAGGLGIMTFGAFFAAIAGRNVRLSEYATLRELLSSEGLQDIRQLVLAILGFTFFSELIGAVLLSTFFDDLAWPERILYSLFHSISAFCNAGFSLTENSFVGSGGRWQIWGVVPALIIIGGLGFAVLYNVYAFGRNALSRWFSPQAFRFPRERVRIKLTTRLVLLTTFSLLLVGTAGVYLLERTGADARVGIRLADAWFQSVTFRTAGFNTVEIADLSPATKLLGICLMIIGASPGSTGGGIKTTVFAVAIVGLLSVLRGRNQVESSGRTISPILVNRSLAIVFVFLVTVMLSTLLLTIFERRPERFLDHMFEASSAAGTVGLSTGEWFEDGTFVSTTQSLTSPSRMVIILTMFLGRIGPLTLLLALAGDRPAVRYEYPQERVVLG